MTNICGFTPVLDPTGRIGWARIVDEFEKSDEIAIEREYDSTDDAYSSWEGIRAAINRRKYPMKVHRRGRIVWIEKI